MEFDTILPGRSQDKEVLKKLTSQEGVEKNLLFKILFIVIIFLSCFGIAQMAHFNKIGTFPQCAYSWLQIWTLTSLMYA